MVRDEKGGGYTGALGRLPREDENWGSLRARQLY